MRRMMNILRTLVRLARKAGPYLVLEIILPGGTAVALLLLLYRTGKLNFMSAGPLIHARSPALAWVTANTRLPCTQGVRRRSSDGYRGRTANVSCPSRRSATPRR